VTCPVLSAPEYGELNCSHLHGNFAFGSTCDFSCQPGFELMGPQSPISCPVLSAPEHGELNCSHIHGNFTFSSTCDFSCQPGFELIGSQSSECVATRTWTGDSPQCKAISCSLLSAPEHGELSCFHLYENFTFGSACDFSCQPGFELIGPQSPVSCPALDAPSHGHLSCSNLHGNFTFNSTCTFSCKEGFIQVGAEMLSDLGAPGIFTNAAYDSTL
ncbi:hypothetical protein CIB84_014970, partial [Bambusicola thoracicus]